MEFLLNTETLRLIKNSKFKIIQEKKNSILPIFQKSYIVII